jgi:hypothetical protein
MLRILLISFIALISTNANAEREKFNGFTGAWWNPERDGEGLLIHELKGEILFAAWFTYSESGSGNQMYLTAAQPISGEELELNFFQTHGASFGDNFVSSDVITSQWGTATLRLTSCDTIEIGYHSIQGSEGQINLTRALPLTADLCDQFTGSKNGTFDTIFTFQSTPAQCVDTVFPRPYKTSRKALSVNFSENDITMEFEDFFVGPCRFRGQYSRSDLNYSASGTFICSDDFVEGAWQSQRLEIGQDLIEGQIDMTGTSKTCTETVTFKGVR